MKANFDDLSPALVVEEVGSVRVVTMNRPDQLNSFDDELHDAIRVVWDRIADDDEIGAVVLTGAGRAFSTGGYMPNLKRGHEDPVARRRDLRHAERIVHGMLSCEVPLVAAVNGPAVGLGASVAVMCDLVVMAETAFMSDPHVSVGLVAGDGGTVIWPLLMSLLKAKEHILLGSRIEATECERLGLANKVVPAAELMPVALDLANRLASQPRQAVRDTKRALNLHLQQAANVVLNFALAAEWESFASDDVRATVERFAKKEGAAKK